MVEWAVIQYAMQAVQFMHHAISAINGTRQIAETMPTTDKTITTIEKYKDTLRTRRKWLLTMLIVSACLSTGFAVWFFFFRQDSLLHLGLMLYFGIESVGIGGIALHNIQAESNAVIMEHLSLQINRLRSEVRGFVEYQTVKVRMPRRRRPRKSK